MLLGGLNAYKCFAGVLDIGYLPYWYVSLTRGFARRSLLGTFTSPFIADLSMPQAILMAAIICTVAGAGLLLCMALAVCAVYRSQRTWTARILWLLVAVVGFASPILPIIGIAISALDQFLFLGCLGLAVAVLRGRPVLSIGLAMAMPLIHEGFMFLALPPLAWLFLRVAGARFLAAVCMGSLVVMTVLLMTVATGNGAFPADVALPRDTIEMFTQYQLSQTTSGSVTQRWNEFLIEWRRYAVALGLGVVPVLVMASLTMLRVRPGRRAACLALVVVGAGFTSSIMTAAWDLWRFLAWGDATALLLCGLEFLCAGKTVQEGDERRPLALVALAGAVLVPTAASLEAPVFIWGTNMLGLADSRPAPLVPVVAQWAERFGDFYNRLPPVHDAGRLDVFRWYYNRSPPGPSDTARLCDGGRRCEVNYRAGS
jgi:hypothetical protein